MTPLHSWILCCLFTTTAIASASAASAAPKPALRALPVMNEVPLYRTAPPGKSDTAIAYLSMKDTLTFLDSARGWSRVVAPKKKEGFVQSRLIVIFDLVQLRAAQEIPKSKTGYAKPEAARSAPGAAPAPSKSYAMEDMAAAEAAPAPEPGKMVKAKRAAPADYKSDAAAVRGAQAGSVKAASHDDNAEFPQYQKFCRDNPVQSLRIVYPWDVSTRLIIRVLDKDSATVPWARVELLNRLNRPVFSALTPASGEIILLPNVDLPEQAGLSLRVNGGDARPLVQRPNEDAVTLALPGKRQLPQALSAQICFLVDATGSMGDEIAQLQDVIFSIHQRLRALPGKPSLEFSLTAYRDQGDEFLVKGRPFTADIDTFQAHLNGLAADGGGDTPEDIEAGLAYALDSLGWKSGTLKFIFLIADAPPHTGQARPDNYLVMARAARGRGVMICPVGASGLDRTGEFVFRQLALLTGGDFVFLHYGEAGESDGAATAADPGKVSHHTGGNYSAKRLDDLVVDIVRRELAYLDPAIAAQRRAPAPDADAEMLDLRLNSLLAQVLRADIGLSGKTVVVTPFAAADPSLNNISDYLWEGALGLAARLAPVKVIERARITEIFKEHALSQTGLANPESEAKVGKLLGADYVLLTRINYLGLRAVCHSRLVDCATGVILSAARVGL